MSRFQKGNLPALAEMVAALDLDELYRYLDRGTFWDSGHLTSLLSGGQYVDRRVLDQAKRLLQVFTDRPLTRKKDGQPTNFLYAVTRRKEFIELIARDGIRRGFRWSAVLADTAFFGPDNTVVDVEKTA